MGGRLSAVGGWKGWRGLLAGFAALTGGSAQAGCNTDARPCTVADGVYHIALPERSSAQKEGGALPAVVMLHGYGGSGLGILRNQSLVDAVTERGFAFIAPEGEKRGRAQSWNFYPGWAGRDETAFLGEVVANSAEQFGVDPDRVLLAGFSAGAFMVNYLACSSPTTFAAYAPVAGGFWRPQPEECAGPVHLFHTHGWRDEVVPLEGRFLAAGQFQQGDIFAGLDLWRRTNTCATHAPDQRQELEDGALQRRWACGSGNDLTFLLFSGGHKIPSSWPKLVLEWFVGLPSQSDSPEEH